MTDIGLHWPSRTLSEVTSYIKDGSHGSHKRVPNGVPLLSAKNISDFGRILYGQEDDRISFEEYEILNRAFSLQSGDLLLTIVGTLGRRAIYSGELVTFQRSVAFLRPKEGQLHPRFFFHATGSSEFLQHLDRHSKATAQKGLYLGDLAQIPISVPPVSHQQSIAIVLDAMDAAIASTEAVIAKLKQVREGLLHDLLTRGLDENGELRDPLAHPKQFQDSPIGVIPKRWRLRPLSEIATFQNGKAFPSTEYGDNGIRLLRPGNLPTEEFVTWEPANTVYLPESWAETAGEYLVSAGELVMNLTAQSLEEQFLGRVCMTRQNECCLLNQRLARFRAIDCYLPFLFWSFRGPHFRLQIDRNPKGTKIQHLYNRDLERIVLPIPNDPDEQERIASILFMSAAQGEADRANLAKLWRLKAGVMSDLLTGKVRVPEGVET